MVRVRCLGDKYIRSFISIHHGFIDSPLCLPRFLARRIRLGTGGSRRWRRHRTGRDDHQSRRRVPRRRFRRPRSRTIAMLGRRRFHRFRAIDARRQDISVGGQLDNVE